MEIVMLQKVDIYIFALFVLILCGVKSYHGSNGKTPQSTAFSTLILLIGIIILADFISVFFDGMSGKGIRTLLIGTTIAGFSLQVLIVLAWFFYVQTVLFPNRKQRPYEILVQSLPALACIGMALCSYWSGNFFSFNEQNVYSRGPLFPVIVITSVVYLVIAYYQIIKYRKTLEKRYLRALLSFVFPPIIGGTIQGLFYGVSFMWPSMSLSVLIIYLAIQNELLLLDYVTSVNNRRSFDRDLTRRIHTASAEGSFALFLIEATNINSIKDRLGHAEGDRLLTNLAGFLKTFFRPSVCIARYNDTIFAVIIDLKNINDLYKIRESFTNAVLEHKTPLTLGIGSAPYLAEEGTEMSIFLLQVEKLLCIDKLIPGDRRLSNCAPR